ncbi:MAG TPA: class I SAM-dependent methyltransferase [Thermoleophilaceae bacterium]
MPACAACASTVLLPHLEVADARAEDLIPTTDRFGAALGDIVRCPACSHMQLDRFPTEAELGEAYGEAASDDYVEEEAGQRETARIALERIERFVPAGGSRAPRAVLDLGCWVGFLLAVARERGWDTLGVEPSEFASTYARERLGLDVIRDDLFEADLGGRRFDAVVMGDVIEHLPRPADALDRMAEMLNPGGVVYLALPNAGSRLARRMGARWWSVIPTHVQYFTHASLFTLLRRRGWEPLWAGTAPKAFTVRYYLERIGGYSPPAAKALVGAASAAGVAERMWAPDFRDRMAVIARAPAAGPAPPAR